MNSLRLREFRFLLVIISLLCSSCGDDDNPVNTGTPVHNVYLEYSRHFVDLESGSIDTTAGGLSLDANVDLYISRNEDGPFRSNIHTMPNRERARLDGVEFSEVTNNDALFASYTDGFTEDQEQFGTDVTYLIRTNEGAIYKLGNPVEDPSGVRFDFALFAASQR